MVEAARRHASTVDSVPGGERAPLFTVRIPLGKALCRLTRCRQVRAVPARTASVVWRLRWRSPPRHSGGSPRWRREVDAWWCDGRATDRSAVVARVLVVDDNADMRDYAARLLRARGWVVETAADGAGRAGRGAPRWAGPG